jgi:peptide/nickel transport system substrate-binding protein
MVEFNIEDTILIGDDVVKIVKIMYEPNPFFREEGKPYFTRVELQGGGDATTAARAVLVEGSVDFAWNLQVDHNTMMAMQAKRKGKVVFTPGPYVERILLNFTDPNQTIETDERSSLRFPHPFFNDKKVRRAFAHAIDREAIAALYGDSARLTTNVLVSPAVYNSPNTANLYPFDLERAAALLDEAGWIDTNGDGVRDKGGITMHVLFQTSVNPIRQKTQQIVKEALESLGVDVELKMIDASIFFSNDPSNDNNFQKFYADLQEYYTGNTTPDPGIHMGWWTCAQVAQQANKWSYRNLARWCNPEYDVLYEQVSTEVAPKKRRNLFIRLNDLLIEEVVLIPLVNRTVPKGISNTLEGIEFTPWDSDTWNIQDWRRK